MTRSWYKENKHIVEARTNGAEIEVRVKGRDEEWRLIDNTPTWNSYCEYRIKPKIKYPIYAKHKKYAIWIKVDEDKEIKELKNNACTTTLETGYKEEEWETIPNPYELHDKDPVWCWDSGDIAFRYVAFYDEQNDTIFSILGFRSKQNLKPENMEKILPWEMTDWMIEAQKKLED